MIALQTADKDFPLGPIRRGTPGGKLDLWVEGKLLYIRSIGC